MSTFVNITEQEFDDTLKASNGWIKEQCGYEYVYSYKMKWYPDITIKVMSSISVSNAKSRNKGQDAIRVFAIRTDDEENIKGYIKKKTVYRVTNWRTNLKNAYMSVREQVIARKNK